MSTEYSEKFMRGIRAGSTSSARAVLPLIFDLLRPTSVIDLGCGAGSWLSVCLELGATDVLGLDGDWVVPENLQFPADRFRPADLKQPVQLDARAELSMSLEVAEHLPHASAEDFVGSLVRLSRVVLFSAAVPRQGGNFHVNEQWPSYWAAKFAGHGYRPIDLVRPKVWNNDAVDYWYAQNTLLYVHDDLLAENGTLAALREETAGNPLDVVHPKLFMMRARRSKLREWAHPYSSALKRFRHRILKR